jgi:hypothetical protein
VSDKAEGLLRKYDVKRVDDPTGKHDDCRYFVLDPEHDPIARGALRFYANLADKEGYGALAAELTEWVDGLPDQPMTA